MSITLNINERFKAELTEKGAEVWNKSFDEAPPKHRPAAKKAGEMIEACLWEIMQVFGPHTWHGMTQLHFKDNSITKLRTHP